MPRYAIARERPWVSIIELILLNKLIKISSTVTSHIPPFAYTVNLRSVPHEYFNFSYLNSSCKRWGFLCNPNILCGARIVLLKLVLSWVRKNYFDECWLANKSLAWSKTNQARRLSEIGLVREHVEFLATKIADFKAPWAQIDSTDYGSWLHYMDYKGMLREVRIIVLFLFFFILSNME